MTVQAAEPSDAPATTPAVSLENDKLVKIFTKIRDARRDLKAKFEESDDALKNQIDIISSEIKSRCVASGITGFKTDFGTVSIVETTKVSCADWSAFGDFLKDKDPLVYLENRVKTTAVKEFIETHGGELPPGISIFRESEARVTAPRKAKASLDFDDQKETS